MVNLFEKITSKYIYITKEYMYLLAFHVWIKFFETFGLLTHTKKEHNKEIH
jgi:hypothetical protein